MQLIVLFGLPGAGKTYIGKIFKDLGFYFYDADWDLPKEMQAAIESKSPITDSMRDLFFKNVIESSKKLTAKHKKIILAQTFIKEKYRLAFLRQFPNTRFIFVKTNTHLRKLRLSQRKDYPLDPEYVAKMCHIFEAPKIKHQTIINNAEGEGFVREQIQQYL